MSNNGIKSNILIKGNFSGDRGFLWSGGGGAGEDVAYVTDVHTLVQLIHVIWISKAWLYNNCKYMQKITFQTHFTEHAKNLDAVVQKN